MRLVYALYVPFLLVAALTVAGALVGNALVGLFVGLLLLFVAEVTD